MQSLVLTGISLIDGTGAPPVRDAAVMTEGGRIKYAGPAAGMPPAAAESRTLHLRGRTVLPGLINTHVHLALNPYRRRVDWSQYSVDETVSTLEGYSLAMEALERGVTTLGDLSAPHHGFIKLGRVIESGMLKGPRIFSVGRGLVAVGGHSWSLGREVSGPDEVTRAVREEIKAGAHQIKLLAEAGTLEGALHRRILEMTPEEIQAAVVAARPFDRMVRVHAITPGPIRSAVEAGAHVIEHGYDLDDEVIALMVERGTYLVPTIQVWKMALLNPDKVPNPDMLRHRKEAQERVAVWLPRAIKAGVKIALGTDGSTLLNPAGEVLIELESLVGYGMTPLQAIQAATKHAADAMGAGAGLGTLAAGMLADLIAVEGDPSADIRALGRVEMVAKGGEVLVDRTRAR